MIPALTGVLAPHGLATSFESIATVTVGSGGSASVSFSSIPQTYQHLQIRYFVNSVASSTNTYQYLRLGTGSVDTGSNYTSHELYGNGTSAAAAAAGASKTHMWAGFGGLTSSSYFAAGIIDLLDYTSTNKYKTIRVLDGIDGNGSGYIDFVSGVWMSSTAVDCLTLYPQEGATSKNYGNYSSFALYGVKA